MSQIEIDVEKRVIEKLSLWLKDSFALCEMGGVRKSTSTAIVMRALMWALISGLMQKGAKKDDLLEIISTNWDLVHKVKVSFDN